MLLAAALAALFVIAGCEKKTATGKRESKVEKGVPLSAPEPALPTTGEFAPCSGDDCMIVPEGILGMVFGMEEAALKARFGRLREQRLSSREIVARPGCDEKQRPPEQRYKVTTTIGGEDADCLLDVLPDGGLVQIACRLDGKRDRQLHAETANVLYRALAKQYGEPPNPREQLLSSGWLSATWQSDAATLMVGANHQSKRSQISVVNTSSALRLAHEKELADLAAVCDAQAAERAGRAADHEAALREKARAFENDLRPPLERPKTAPTP